ncbi:MAG: hypothetical protein ACTSSP_06020 [Candidatus Asgardarchaeia archaeon]
MDNFFLNYYEELILVLLQYYEEKRAQGSVSGVGKEAFGSDACAGDEGGEV